MTEDAYTTLIPVLVIGVVFLAFAWNVYKVLKPQPSAHSLRSVAILVLGDIGRSPRMMYHAESFAELNFVTDLIGYAGSKPIPALERQPKVQIRHIPDPPKSIFSLPFVLSAPLKISHQFLAIIVELCLAIEHPPEFILVQNPPTIPTLVIARLVSWARGCKVIIDWHNLGYSILALKVGENHPFVKVYEWFEKTFGRSAHAHIFVTQAMHDYLVKEWDLKGAKVVLHDRPPKHFSRSSPQTMHDLFVRLDPSYSKSHTIQDFLPKYSTPYSTPWTETSGEDLGSGQSTPVGSVMISSPFSEIKPPTLRSDRPALLVSSTSWTPDEDFSILLEALERYEEKAKAAKGMLPKLMCVVTGKGPERLKYMKLIGDMELKWDWVRCISMWLEAADYPVLLGCADLGVSLHKSSSNLDLPMKVVDMFGCRLPVCALNFDCLSELVKDGINGLVFKDSEELADQLETLFTGFPRSPRLDALRDSFNHASKRPSSAAGKDKSGLGWEWGTWDDNWNHVVKPLILHDAIHT